MEEDAGADVDEQEDDGETTADGDHGGSDGIGDGVDANGIGLAWCCGEGTTIKGSEECSGQQESEDTDTQEGVVQVGAGFVEGEFHDAGSTSHECHTGDKEEVEESNADDGCLEETEVAAEEEFDGEDNFDDVAASNDDEVSKGLSAVESDLLTAVFEEFAEGNDGDEGDWEDDEPVLP